MAETPVFSSYGAFKEFFDLLNVIVISFLCDDLSCFASLRNPSRKGDSTLSFFRSIPKILFLYKMRATVSLAPLIINCIPGGFHLHTDMFLCPIHFFPTIPDKALEHRMIMFCRLINMNSDEFQACIQRDYVNHFWLGAS